MGRRRIASAKSAAAGTTVAAPVEQAEERSGSHDPARGNGSAADPDSTEKVKTIRRRGKTQQGLPEGWIVDDEGFVVPGLALNGLLDLRRHERSLPLGGQTAPGGQLMLRSILVALDETPASSAAQRLVIDMARRFDCQITGITILDRAYSRRPRRSASGAWRSRSIVHAPTGPEKSLLLAA